MPTLPLSSLLSFRRKGLPSPLDRPSASLWFSARIALWQAIRALGLKAGDAIAAPAFCCGSELEPFIHAGMELQFFGATPELNPDPESLELALEGASAALVTHYFGFPADLTAAAAACRSRGIPLIEDCAHALYSRTPAGPVGEVGQAAVFSLWKTLAIPDGAALLLGGGARVAAPPEKAAIPARLVAAATRHLVVQGFRAGTLPLRWAAAAAGSIRRRRPEGAGDREDVAAAAQYELIRFRPELVQAGMSDRSLRLVLGTDHAVIFERRRRRYEELAAGLEGLPGIRPVFRTLPGGACPLFFPAMIEDPAPLRRAMAAEGIGVKHIWPFHHPRVPWDRFPLEHRMKDAILGFPVHQSLRDADVARIIAAVRRHARS